MLNSIGLQNPGIDALPARQPAAARASSASRSGSRSAASRRPTTRDVCARLDERDDVVHDRAEPLLPERRGGARDRGRARRRGRAATTQAALREALAGDVGHRRVRPRGRRRGRRRLSLDQHDPRPRARHGRRAARCSRAAPAATPGPALQADRARVRLRVRRGRRPADRRHGRRRLGRDALDFVAAGASAVALGTVLFSDPWAPGRIRAELEADELASRRPSARRSCANRRPPQNCSLDLDNRKSPANRLKRFRLTARATW